MSVLRDLDIVEVNPGVCTGPGRWAATTDSGLLTSYNPASGAPLARVHLGSVHDLEAVLQETESAFPRWRETPGPARAELVLRIGEAMAQQRQSLASLISMETGLVRTDAEAEVDEAVEAARQAFAQARQSGHQGSESRRGNRRVVERRHPLGTVGIITGFRRQLATWAGHGLMAAAMGNTVVWKPSPKAPLVAVAVQHLCNRVLEESGRRGIFTLVTDRHGELAQAMAGDARLALICFNGYAGSARRVSEAVGRRLGRAIVSTGGNNAVIVEDSADLDLATDAVVSGLLNLAGQQFTSTRRLLVQEARCRELTDRLISRLRGIKIGDPLDPLVGMGPLIGPEVRTQFQNALVSVRAWGGEVLYGGQVLDVGGNFVQPTLVRARNHWDVVQREMAVPILYVITYRTFEEALALQNGVSQGLVSSLFSNDLRIVERYLSASGSDCGMAHVNLPTTVSEVSCAAGGEKASGVGRRGGREAWRAYMRAQSGILHW